MWQGRNQKGPLTLSPLSPLPSPQGLSVTHIFGWTQGVCGNVRLQPRRGDLTKPRPTAWVKKISPLKFASPERARQMHRSSFRGHARGCDDDISPFQGLRSPKGQALGPRPLAWALLDRPFGAQSGIICVCTPCVQQKMWDTLSPGEREEGEGLDFGPLRVRHWRSRQPTQEGRRISPASWQGMGRMRSWRNYPGRVRGPRPRRAVGG